MSNLLNLILLTDSYKQSHYRQYPPGTQKVYSYIESRGGKYDNIMFFGLQRFILAYLTKPVTVDDVNQADEVCSSHGVPFNREGWMHIVEKHGGRLPIHIRAVKEGSLVPAKNVIVDIENTDPECAWLTCFIETALLQAVWYPSTVASRDKKIYETIKHYMRKTADDAAMAGIGFKHNDFGVRGVSSMESAKIGGMAHLVTSSVRITCQHCLMLVSTTMNTWLDSRSLLQSTARSHLGVITSRLSYLHFATC